MSTTSIQAYHRNVFVCLFVCSYAFFAVTDDYYSRCGPSFMACIQTDCMSDLRIRPRFPVEEGGKNAHHYTSKKLIVKMFMTTCKFPVTSVPMTLYQPTKPFEHCQIHLLQILHLCSWNYRATYLSCTDICPRDQHTLIALQPWLMHFQCITPEKKSLTYFFI